MITVLFSSPSSFQTRLQAVKVDTPQDIEHAKAFAARVLQSYAGVFHWAGIYQNDELLFEAIYKSEIQVNIAPYKGD